MLEFLEKNKDITELSNFKTPAKTKYYFELKNEEELDNLFEINKFAKKNNLKIFFISWGTNLLFAFDIFEGILVKNNLKGWSYDKTNSILESYSDESIWEISYELEEKYNQNLWHRFIWLPWSIWWAVFWNAGCFGLEIENNFLKWEVLNLDNGKKEILSKKEMNFSYRNSILKKTEGKYFLIKSSFDLSKKIEKYSSKEDNIYFREHKQPNWLSCGSFFKNPSKDESAWYLIEQVWLKWFNIWWAFFSNKHANFLMNDGSWTYKDLLSLIELAQKKVKEKFWIELVNEVRIISNQLNTGVKK